MDPCLDYEQQRDCLINSGMVLRRFRDKSYLIKYRNDPKFADRYAWANSADPDQTGSTLFAIPSASFGLITLW